MNEDQPSTQPDITPVTKHTDIEVAKPSEAKDDPIRRSDLLKLLDAEIQTIFQKQSWQGWTSWALLGAIAALGWLLLQRLETGTFLFRNVVRLFLCMDLCQIGFGIFVYAFFSRDSEKKSGRFRYMDVYEFRSLLLISIYLLADLFIVLTYNEGVNKIALVFLVGFLGIMPTTFVGLGIFARLSRMPFEISSAPPGWKGKSFCTVLTVILLLAGTNYFFSIDIKEVSFDDFRISLLVTILATLVNKLTITSRDAPTVQSLTSIRRELALGNIDIQVATNQTEMVLAGMRVGDVLQQELRSFMGIVEKITAAYHDIIVRIDAILPELAIQGQVLSEDRLTDIKSILDLCETNNKKTLKEFDTMKAHRIELRSRIRWIGRKTPEASQGVEAVHNAITNAYEYILSKMSEYDSKYKQIGRHLDSVRKGTNTK